MPEPDPTRRLAGAAALLATALASGCAAYRVDSNVDRTPASAAVANEPVIVSEGALADRPYVTVGPIEVSVKKLTIFHDNPTREQANAALIERARALGADAVINVTYSSGVGLTTWGYMDARGTAVRFAR